MSLTSEQLGATKDPPYPTSRAVHVPANEGPTTWFAGDTYTIKASRESTNGSLALVEATVPPGGGPIAHVHTRTDEAFFVLSGRLEILDGARTFVADTGDFVFIPRGTRHRFKNTGVHGARMLFMFTPGGDEGVFRFGDEPRPGHPPPIWDAERFKTPEISRFNEEFGIEIIPEQQGELGTAMP
jgi:mannose-6-phosphate isomerase-like protein (cupin superfamily)